ncbi:MAG: hypothetical protein JNM47_08790 [Hyphomonadaceae bacterium]|nr:hypothetical protein [Hyphomonadaceae bacterium]
MSLTKRIWFDRDPAYEHVRQQAAKDLHEYSKQLPHRIALRRRSRGAPAGYWDPFWRRAVSEAAKERDVEHLNVNDGMFVRTAEDKLAVEGRAAEIWREKWKKLGFEPQERPPSKRRSKTEW